MTRDHIIAQWRAFDRVMVMLNGLDIPEGITPDGMRRMIYGLVHDMRPNKPFCVSDDTSEKME